MFIFGLIKDTKKMWIRTAVMLLITVCACVFVFTYDVAEIGPCGTSVGCSTFNAFVAKQCPYSAFYDTASDVLAFVAFAIIGFFALLGLSQWIRRKSLLRVDPLLYALASLYILLGVLYLVFDKLALNYRPILEAGESFPEASFPSSHMMLACVVFCSAILMLYIYLKNEKVIAAGQLLLFFAVAIMFAYRTLAGVHWITDILCGVLISTTLLTAFAAVLSMLPHDGLYVSESETTK